MKKILVLLSACSIAALCANAAPVLSGKMQERWIDNITKNSAGKLGKRGTVTVGGTVGKMDLNQSGYDGNVGGGAFFELAMAAYKTPSKNFGIDIAIPISYFYSTYDITSVSSKQKLHTIDIPVQIRPYFKYAFTKNIAVAPFGFASAGAAFNSFSSSTAIFDDGDYTNFMYNVGGGVQFDIYMVAITPKFTYQNLTDVDKINPSISNSSNYLYEKKEISVEAAVNLVKNWTFVVEYTYMLDGLGLLSDEVEAHTVKAGMRLGW